MTVMRKAKGKIALLAAAAMLAVVALQVVAVAHTFDEETTTTFNYSEKKDKFKGRAKSDRKRCQRTRKVEVFKRRDGEDKFIGDDTTNDGGYWGVPEANANGHYYVKIKEKHITKTHHNHRCRGTRKDIDV